MIEPKPYIITIVGPESSGKTTLARQLAMQFGCPWVPEYAREYLEKQGGYYNETDLEQIAIGQLDAIRKVMRSLESSVFGLQSFFGRLQMRLEENIVLAFQREDFGVEPRPLLIVDSGMLTMRMWARIKYGSTIPIVEEALKEDVTSMYVLCRPVLPWGPDPLREAPVLLDRAWIYNQYLKEVFTLQVK